MARTYLGYTQTAANADLDELAAGTAAGWIQSGAGAVERTVSAKLRETLSLQDFGASPSKTGTENGVAVQAMIDAAMALGGARMVGAPGAYTVTRTVTHDIPFPISAANYQPAVLSTASTFYALEPTGLHFDMPGVTFVSTETGGGNNDAVFLFDGARDCTFNFRVTGACVVSPTTGLLTTTGRHAILLTSTTRDSWGNQIPSLTADSCFSAVYVVGVTLGTYRVRGTRLGTINIVNGYRGLMLFDNGDDTSVDAMVADSATRLFFIFGVDGVRGHFHNRSQNSGLQSLVGGYDRDTNDIDISYRVESVNVGAVRLQFFSSHSPAVQPTAAVTRNVRLNYNDSGSAHPALGIGFRYEADDVNEPTVAQTIFDNFHLSGTMRDSTFQTFVQQTPVGLLSLDGLVVTGTANAIPDYAIFADAGFYPLVQIPNAYNLRFMRASPNETGLAARMTATAADNFQFVSEVTGKLIQLLTTAGKVQFGTVAAGVRTAVSINGLELLSLTNTQRDALTGLTEGTVIFNTDTNVLNQYNGAAWRAITDTAV